MLTHSFEDLAQSFRVLMESNFSFLSLLHVDRAEAIGNLEAGLNTQLNAFHNLYDNMLQNKIGPDWYQSPELLTMLVIRNARHHNKANRIRTLYNYHRLATANPLVAKNYHYVNFPMPPEEEGGGCFDVPISWEDIDTMLSLPKNESRLKPEVRGRVRDYLNANAFEQKALEAGSSKSEIFINYVPLSLNAAIALYPHIVAHVLPNDDSVEAKFFLYHFKNTALALTAMHQQAIISFQLPD